MAGAQDGQTAVGGPPAASMRRVGSAIRRPLARTLVVVALVLGANYLAWRLLFSIHWQAWYIAVPLVVAETYSYVCTVLFGLTAWRMQERDGTPPTPPGLTVDVLITCYDEPADLVRQTVRHAVAIRYPHKTYVLDDGPSASIEQMAGEEGVGYLTRGRDWLGKPRHAKAGNLSNALFETTGEFLLILDADQVPSPRILDRTLGYFADPRVAIVQTPQRFYNVTATDPLGCQAPLFYGPIQEGKDGWNAAFFCGSNAVLRREALMRLGIIGYVASVREAIVRVLSAGRRMLRTARRHARAAGDPAVLRAVDAIDTALRQARLDLAGGMTAQEVATRFQHAVDRAARLVVARDLERIREDVAALEPMPVRAGPDDAVVVDVRALTTLSRRDVSPLAAILSLRALVRALDVDRSDEALPVMPLSTISVTEDLATALRLHSHGWRSVYHGEVLALGLAPEDLGSALKQRLRWAEGSLQVLLKDNPLTLRGLSPGQRLMYMDTMLSYLQGFAIVIYILAPALYLLFGVSPVRAFSPDLFSRLILYLAANQLLLMVVAWGRPVWRGQQYSLALFPVWIQATINAARSVATGRGSAFQVTPKRRQEGIPLLAILPQTAALIILTAGVVTGALRLILDPTVNVAGVVSSLVWAGYDLLALSVIVRAVGYRGPGPELSTLPRID